ncbi:hypothetical protein QBC37DRAFT_420240 [Rhypophila decipiens]|uniref:Uncharacterized protein n=1 Tax=Rhypophila decipiens TaxID=261697 RepID=A0AAN7B8P6_9PEZI|nr:hypothetical protein QBC37DRAFT_420240 [Rhypophila decipiens]
MSLPWSASNRTCKRLQHLTTRSIYQCPQTKSHQATWYLTRTLLARPDLAAMVEFLVLGRCEALSTFPTLPPRPRSRIRITTPCILPPAPISQAGGVLLDEVLSQFRNIFGLECEISCCYDALHHRHPVCNLPAIRLHNSAPVDLITSLCPNVEALETDGNVTLVNPGGVFWSDCTFDFRRMKWLKIRRRAPAVTSTAKYWRRHARRLEALHAGSTCTLPKLKSLKLWQTEDPIHMPFQPVFYHALRISPAIENLVVRGLSCVTFSLELLTQYVSLPIPLSLRRLRLEDVTSIQLSKPVTDLLQRFPNLQHLVFKFHGRKSTRGYRLPGPRADAEELAEKCPPGMKRIEMDITQMRQNPRIRRNWYCVETYEALKQLGTALLAEKGIEYVWRE